MPEMSAPSVRLLLKGQLVDEVPFRGPMLRIGRMKENEVVINNLSVSRFHATLSREGDAFVLRDLGSENGCWVNGERVNEARVGPADAILIGKHQLELVAGPVPADAPDAAAPRGRSDAWDAANTYLVGVDTRAKMLGQPAPGAPPAAIAPGAPEAPRAPAAAAPDPGEGVELFGDEPPGDLAGPDLAEFDVSELEVGAEDELLAGSEAPEPAGAPDDEEATLLVDEVPAEAPAAPERLHAGVLVQRGGRLEKVVPWEGERLTLGRAADCDVCLGTAEVSRRHALLVREGERYEVRDLESINGTYVNKERVTRRTLAVGDVIRIEDFELTFVLDRAPLGDAVQAPPAPPGPATAADAGGLTQLGEVLDLAPFVASEAEGDANAMSFDALPPAAPEAPPEAPPEPEAAPLFEPGPPPAAAPVLSFDAEPPGETLLVEDALLGGDDEKELAAAPAGPTVRFELKVRVEELPPALREALAALDESDLRLPVELRLARE
jgi:pSer/pThr/pTyr-binding forkhead associated (FHA) protein